MDDLTREIAVIREELTPEWDTDRSERLLDGIARLDKRRRMQRLYAAGAFGAAAALALLLGVQEAVPRAGNASELAGGGVPAAARRGVDSAERNARPSVAPGPIGTQPMAAEAISRIGAGQRVRLADGSLVSLASDTGELGLLRNEPGHVALRLLAGRAHFDVVPNTQRRFVVDAGSIQVAVVGTVFDVERVAERVRVSVLEGKVRVSASDGIEFVQGGENAWFDAHGARLADAKNANGNTNRRAPGAQQPNSGPDQDQTAPPAAGTPPEVSAPRSSAVREHAAKAKRQLPKEEAVLPLSWRSLCQSGDYDGAYRLLGAGAKVDDDPAALMDAADAARLSNHAQASVSYLRRVLREHSRSPVAPLAGFTLGRVLLERLGQPLEAAEAFALARRIAPHGSLAQDALAREVEAWSKAGNSHEAYQRARLYVQSYPTGRRLQAVRIYGGLE